MINFDSIPANVQQFMIDKMTNNVTQHSTWCLIMGLIYVALIVVWIVLTIKGKSAKLDSFLWLSIDVLFLVFEIFSFCSDRDKIEQYQNNPQSAVVDYIKNAYNDDEYCNELYIRGVDIYGNYEG